MLTFEKAFEKYKAYMIRCNYSKVTLKKKEEYLKRFIWWVSNHHEDGLNDLRGVSCDNLLDYMDFLFLEGLEAYTVKVYMAHLKSFFGFLYRYDLVESDPTRKLPFVKTPKKEIVYVPHDEIMKNLASMFDDFKKGALYKITKRNYFIIRCAYSAGWRASESLNCEIENINWDTGEVYLPKRKGGKDGFVYLDMDTCRELKEWYFKNYPNGKYLWYSRDGERLSYSSYNEVFIKCFGKSSHRIRASLATYLISQEVPIKDVADLLGHENINTTLRYAASIKTRIKDVHERKNPFSKL
jgi:integrase/recombinase XerD